MSSNAYSQRWHETFSKQLDGAADVALLAEWLPRGRVLDVCCGFGRHKRGLEERGWEVVGVERDPEVAAAAGALCLDMRELHQVDGTFDAVICMWASFGYFAPAENRRVLEAMIEKLKPGGRLVLELFNGEFFVPRQGVREISPGSRRPSASSTGVCSSTSTTATGSTTTWSGSSSRPPRSATRSLSHASTSKPHPKPREWCTSSSADYGRSSHKALAVSGQRSVSNAARGEHQRWSSCSQSSVGSQSSGAVARKHVTVTATIEESYIARRSAGSSVSE